ncbi:hypothetical protein [Polyangium spumosum]|uniref:Lipoprotein n=1 Tax=Polyangium spumosum TaxID=889282 RepID=A0A6N7PNP2_9BACT|nr:hypothetical protein [Polyangium spumosum]MRG93633.1 hypothetical protein [Polyangium spumosum]
MRAPLLVATILAAFSSSCAAVDDGSIKPEPRAEAPKVVAPLPPEFGTLGEPCPPPGPLDPGAPHVGCGKDGRVGLITAYRRTGLPEGAQKLEGSMGRVEVLVEADRVWVQGTCIFCRSFTEQTSIVHLAHATDEQLMQIQMQAELSNKSPLRDANAWRGAIAAWEPKR